jgi:hypothetical protein
MHRNSARLAAPLIAVVTCAVGAVGYLSVMTGFATYDDEGYFLSSLRGYEHGHALFNDIYTQYGPFYWQFIGGLFAATGVTIDHDSGRIFTLLLWCGTAAFSAATVWRLTRNIIVSCGVAMLVMHALYLFPSEPISAGHLTVFFVAALCLALTLPPRLALASAGVLVACLLLIKINVGAFALLGVLLPLSARTGRARLSRIWSKLVAVSACLAPLLLMYSHLSDTAFLQFALHISLAVTALALVLQTLQSERNPFTGRSQILFLSSFVAFACADVLLTWGTGSSLTAIWDSVVRDALTQPNFFFFAPAVPRSALILDVVSLAAAGVVFANRSSFAEWCREGVPLLALGVTRIAAGGVVWLSLSAMHTPLGLAIPVTWLAALPSRLDDPLRRWRVAAVSSVALLETLQAYPVAGSQRGWGSFALIIVGGILISDGAREVAATFDEIPGRRLARAVAAAAAGEAVLAALVLPLPGYVSAFRQAEPLGLSGARLVRADATTAHDLQAVVTALKTRCTTFVSMPGLGSFYLFANETPPTLLISSGWMLGINPGDQERAVKAVEAASGVCVLRNTELTGFWLGATASLPNRPLVNYIVSHSTNAAELSGGYSLAPPS